MKNFVLSILIFWLGTSVSIAQNFNQYSSSTLLNNYGNATGGTAMISTLNKKENTKGTRYLFDNWIKGSFVNAKGEVVNVDSARYNFDKQSNNLIVTTDMQQIILITPSQLKSVTLNDGQNSYNFVYLPQISTDMLFLALVQDSSKYSLYKSVRTKFEPANYQTNGISESGHSYDEYIDNNTYYITKDNKNFIPLTLKRKALKDAFADKKEIVSDYMDDHDSDDINQDYLIGLVNAVNR